MTTTPILLTDAIIIAALLIGVVLVFFRDKGASGSISIFAYAVCLVTASFLYLVSGQAVIADLTVSSIVRAATVASWLIAKTSPA